MDPSYPLVAEVSTANIKHMYRLLIPGSLYHVTRGNSRPPISKVFFDDVQRGILLMLEMNALKLPVFWGLKHIL
jgi:hypothetical protein